MKTQKWIGLLALLTLGLVILVAPARAEAGSRGNENLTGDIVVSFDNTEGRWKSTSVVLYDENWQALEEVETHGRAHMFAGVKAGSYHVAAYSDESIDLIAEDVSVLSAQTAYVNVKWGRWTNVGWPKADATRWCGGAYGDGNLLKVAPPLGQTIIYLQCGRVVDKVLAGGGCPGCGGVSGGWRYVNSCVKSPPIYVNLPCPRH